MNHRFLKTLKENFVFAIILIFFVIYYIYRLFVITPWYDEVFTYINFIDKGTVYSATHWPLPNNHVFFSMISAFFKLFGNYIGLRGVSFLAAIGTIVLLYIFLKHVFSRGIAEYGIMVYGMLIATNLLAIQGRGYSLATFFLMLSLYCGYQISYLNEKRRYYILFTLALYLGLYTLMTSIYWVMSICMCFGVLLLLLKKYKKLLRLVLSSIVAAILAVVSYSVLWLSMGAQSIQAELSLSDSLVHIVFEYPRTSLKRGVSFMMADGNLQSIDRNAFIHDFRYFFRDVLGSFVRYRNNSMLLVFSVGIILILAVMVFYIASYKRKAIKLDQWKELLGYIISSIGFLIIYLILLIQSVYPFARVFSFAGIYLAVLNCLLLNLVVKSFCALARGKKVCKYLRCINIPIFVFFVFQMTDLYHNQEYELTITPGFFNTTVLHNKRCFHILPVNKLFYLDFPRFL